MDDYRLAIKKAGLRAAVYLAAAAKEIIPDETQIYELRQPLSTTGQKICRASALSFPSTRSSIRRSEGDSFLRQQHPGFPADDRHPDEILDGALMFSYSAFTYFAQNHPVIHELYRRHQRDLWFAGVIVSVAPVTIVEKQRDAHLAARLASEVLGAEGVIATKIGGGAVDTDLMLIYQRCEEMGVKAALIIRTLPGHRNHLRAGERKRARDTWLDPDPIVLPPVERVIGGDTLFLDNADPDNTDPGISACRPTRAAGLGRRHCRCHQPGRSFPADHLYGLMGRIFSRRSSWRKKFALFIT